MAVVIETSLDTEQAQRELDALQQTIANDLVSTTERASNRAGDALADGLAEGASEARDSVTEELEKVKKELEDLKTSSAEAGESLGQLVLSETVDKFGDFKDIIELTGTGLLGLKQEAVDSIVKIGDIAEKGASIGAAFGPWGAAAGLAIGGVIGYFNDMAEAQQKNAEKQRQIEQAILDTQLAALNLKQQIDEIQVPSLSSAAALAEVQKLDGELAKLEEKRKQASLEEVKILNATIDEVRSKQYELQSQSIKSAKDEVLEIQRSILEIESPKTAQDLERDLEKAKKRVQETKLELASFFQKADAGLLSFPAFFAGLDSARKALADLTGAQAKVDAKKASSAGSYNKKQAEADRAAEESLKKQQQLVTDFFSIRSEYLQTFVQDSIKGQAQIQKAELEAQKKLLEGTSTKGLSKEAVKKITSQIEEVDSKIKQLDLSVPIKESLQAAQKALQESGLAKDLQETFAIKLSTAQSVEEIQKLTEEIQSLQTPFAFLESLEQQNAEFLKTRAKDIQQITDETMQMLDDGTSSLEDKLKEASEEFKKTSEKIQNYMSPIGEISAAVFDKFIEGLEEGNVALAELGQAAQEALKGVLLSIAKESAAKALQMTAYGIAALITAPAAAPAFFSSAATHAAVAAAAGLGGAALAAANGASARSGGGGGNSSRGASDLGSRAGSGDNAGVSAPIVVDLRGAMFPTSDLTAAQKLGEAVAQSIAAAAGGGQPNARRLVGRGFIR